MIFICFLEAYVLFQVSASPVTHHAMLLAHVEACLQLTTSPASFKKPFIWLHFAFHTVYYTSKTGTTGGHIIL